MNLHSHEFSLFSSTISRGQEATETIRAEASPPPGLLFQAEDFPRRPIDVLPVDEDCDSYGLTSQQRENPASATQGPDGGEH
jgi:hypothetical protein